MSANPELVAALRPLVSRVRTDVTAKKDAGGMSWTREPLTDLRLAKHLNGGPARGVCPIKAGESVTMVGLLDFDSHKGESTWDEMAAAAIEVIDELSVRGMAPVAFRSSGGRGIHIYLLWDAPQDAYSVRMFLVDTLTALGYSNGTGGVKARQIEVFPKQDSVPADGFGNQFILPLAGQSEPLSMFDLEPVGKDAAIGMTWPMSPAVPVLARSVRTSTVSQSVDATLLDRALAAIPNDIDDRDEWFRLMCAFKEGGGDKETARAWTMQHPSYDEAKFDGPWESITIGKENGTPVEYLLNVAHQHGFGEHIVADFPIVAEAKGAAEPDPMPAFLRDKQGRIEATVTNTVAAVARADLVGLQVAYDEFRDEVTVAMAGTELQWRPMTDADAVTIRMGLERVGFKAAPKELARDACIKVAADNHYDSAMLWLGSLRWDGKRRVDTFLIKYMGCEDTPYTRAVARYMWSAMAGRIMQPGVKADMVPIYEGDQGLRKSSAIEALAPSSEFFVEIDLEEREEDTVRKLRGALIGEIAELSGLHTRALEAIKKFVVRKVEKWVPKYKEFPSTFARRLLFIGTTNRTDILADETGNRRWLPLHISKADVDGIVAVRDQLWAEGAALFAEHGVIWQGAEALALEHHDNYTIEDTWEPAVQQWLTTRNDFDEDGPPNSERAFTTAEVMVGALRLNTKEQDRLAQRRVGAILRAFGYVQKTTRIAGTPERRWRNANPGTCDAGCNVTSVSDLA